MEKKQKSKICKKPGEAMSLALCEAKLAAEAAEKEESQTEE